MNRNREHAPYLRGYFTLFVLMVASLFLWYLDTLVSSVVALERMQAAESGSLQAFASAEAGLEYYRWHLAHFPSDLTDGTGISGPYVHTITDNLGTAVGSFSLSIGADVYCGTTTDVAITSTGTNATSTQNTASQTLFARYAEPSVAASAYTTAPAFDPSSTTALLPTLETDAQQNGIYLPPNANNGYKIVLNADGSLTAYNVTAVRQIWGYSAQNGWQEENSIISSLDSGTTYAVPAACPLVFVNAPAWVEGTVSGRVALVSSSNVYLTNNVTYENASGDGLTVIGKENVLISLQSPDVLTLQGVYVALSGMFGRNEYLASGPYAVPSDLAPDVTRTSLTVLGTVASFASSTVEWSDGNGNFLSGYSQDSYTMDASLAKRPPPFAPPSTTTPRFIDWEEMN